MGIKKIRINGKSIEELNDEKEIEQRIESLENLVKMNIDTTTRIRLKKIIQALKKKLLILEKKQHITC